MQPVLHAQIASEASHFDIVDVLEEISDKLVRRHPHVFGDTNVENSDAVLQNWDAIKKEEKAAKLQSAGAQNSDGQNFESILSNIPKSSPALALAQEISKKAAKTGFEWPDAHGVLEKLHEEVAELQHEVESGSRERVAEELGDLLFTAVNVARWHKVDAELALRDTIQRFSLRFEQMEKAAQHTGRVLEELSPQEWDDLWNTAKRDEKRSG
jgi:MazG family protein